MGAEQRREGRECAFSLALARAVLAGRGSTDHMAARANCDSAIANDSPCNIESKLWLPAAPQHPRPSRASRRHLSRPPAHLPPSTVLGHEHLRIARRHAIMNRPGTEPAASQPGRPSSPPPSRCCPARLFAGAVDTQEPPRNAILPRGYLAPGGTACDGRSPAQTGARTRPSHREPHITSRAAADGPVCVHGRCCPETAGTVSLPPPAPRRCSGLAAMLQTTSSWGVPVLTRPRAAGAVPQSLRGIPGGFGGAQQPQQPGRTVSSNRLPNGKLGEETHWGGRARVDAC